MENRSYQIEENLLAAIAKGNQGAFVELFNSYYSQLGSEILAVTGSLNLAEQGVQDAFIMVWLQRKGFAHLKECREYLFVISRNMALAAMKEEQMRVEGLVTGPSEHPLAHSRELVRQAAGQLPSLQKQVYRMTTLQRFAVQDIAILLDITPEQVKKLIYDSLRFVRMELSKCMPPYMAVVLTSTLVP